MATLGAKSDSDVNTHETMDGLSDLKPVAYEKTGTVMAGYTVITKSMIGAGMVSI